MVDVLSNSLVFFAPMWDFPRALSDRETSYVVALLSLMGDFCCSSGRRYVCFWNPCPFEGFSCKSFFLCLVNPSTTSGVFSSLWTVKVPNKVKFFCVAQVLHKRVNTLDWVLRKVPNLIGPMLHS